MTQKPADSTTSGALSREGKITALTLLKSFYDEDVFNLLVKEFYNSDIEVSEAAIVSSGSLGNEIAIPHLYKIIERGRKSQRIAAIRALAAIRAPSSTGMLIKYFNHFPEEELRTEILRAINIISPSGQQVQELNQVVYVDAKQNDTVKQVAAESLVEAERFPALKDTLPRASAGVQQAALKKMLQSGSQEVIDLPEETLSPGALGCYLCLQTMKAKNLQANTVLETLQNSRRETVYSFLESLSQFQGRLRFPTRVFRLLLIAPYVDTETERLVGDFLKKIVVEVKSASPHLLSEFSVVASAHLDNIFAKVRKNYISLTGITNKQVLLATVMATLLEKYATPNLLADVVAFFKDDTLTARTPPLAQVRSLLSSAPREDLNRLEACIPLFAYTEKKDKLLVLSQLSKVELNRPFYMRRLNRLIRVAGALEIRSASKRIQEILDFSRAERIHFLEETSVVTLCQLLTRSIIEQSREYFKEPGKNVRSLNGYIRGARFIPARIMLGALVQVLLQPSLNPQSRALVVDTLESLESPDQKEPKGLAESKKLLPPLLHIVDMKDVDDALKLRVGDILCRNAESSIGHQAIDLTNHSSPVGKKMAARLLRALTSRGEGVTTDIVTNRLYLLLEDKDKGVRVEALLALLALGDDYAAQVLRDFVQSGDEAVVSDVLAGLSKPLSREVFGLVLDMIRMSSSAVQQALRRLLPDVSEGGFAEELRQHLLTVLSVVPGERAKPVPAGAVLEAAPGPAESSIDQAKLEFKFRRENTQVLTVFFIDIAGFTEKTSTSDMSSTLKLIKAFEEIVTTTIAANRGTIVKKMGDGILAAFKHPLSAAVAALGVQQKIHEYSAMRVEQEKFQARIGLNSGPVIRRDNDIFGDVVNVASRMQSAATPGEVVLTEATYYEIQDYVRCTGLGRIQVKGIKDAIMAYSAKEITVDLGKLQEQGGAGAKEKRPLRDSSLQKLKESMFVPSFQVPSGSAENEGLANELKAIFSELSRAVEDISSDYHEEYAFKRYLQDKWNAIVERL